MPLQEVRQYIESHIS
jgi:hypothetical protein